MVVRPQLSGSTCGLLIDQMLQGFGLRLGQWPDDVRVGFAECRYLRLLGLNQTVGGIQVCRQPLGQGIGILNGRGLNHLMLYEVRQTVETDLLLQLYLPDPALDCLWQVCMRLLQFCVVAKQAHGFRISSNYSVGLFCFVLSIHRKCSW